MDETSFLNVKFHSRVSSAFNFMTHKELVIMSREFYFTSLFLNTLSCHRKCLCDNLFDANETHMKHVIKTSYTIKWEFHVTLVLRNCLFWFENWLSTLYFIRMEPWNTSKYVTWLLSSALINALLYYSTRSEVDLTRPLGWKRRTEMSTSLICCTWLALVWGCYRLMEIVIGTARCIWTTLRNSVIFMATSRGGATARAS